MKKFEEICAACGKTFGRHYGTAKMTICTRHEGEWIGDTPMGYQGTFWAPTGIYRDNNGKFVVDTNNGHFRAAQYKETNDPNMLFKVRRKK